jgi:F-type H+-transporting ATPase subunit b
MLNIDATLFLQMINFLLIFIIGKKLIYDPMLSNIETRDNKINELLSSAQKLRSEVEIQKSEYEKRLQQIKSEVIEYQNKVRKEAIDEANKKVAKVKEEIDKKISESKMQLEEEVKKAKSILEKEAKEISQEIVAKIIGKVA